MPTERGGRLRVFLLLPLNLEDLVCFQQNTQPLHCLPLTSVQMPGTLLLTPFFSHFLLHVALLREQSVTKRLFGKGKQSEWTLAAANPGSSEICQSRDTGILLVVESLVSSPSVCRGGR